MGRHGDGSFDEITRRGHVYARFRITIDGTPIERTASSRAALEKVADDLRKRARRGLVTDDEEITLAAWALDRWLAAKRTELGDAGARTIANYASVLNRHVVPALGTVKLRDLRAEHRRRLQRSLVAAGLKASTVNKIDDVLQSILQAAADEDLPVVASAIRAVKPVKARPEKKRTLSGTQVRAILAVGDAWRAMWVAYVFTGARDAEVRALRWSDWDQTAGLLTIRRQLPQQPGDPPAWQEWLKGRKIERVVPVVEPLAVVLRAHKARQNAARLALGRDQWCDYDLVFCDEVGRALRATRVGDRFHAACGAAGVAVWKGLGVHALRHAANNVLREAGVDTPLRSQILGHTQAINEGVYTAENLRLAADALGKLARALA